MSASSRLQEEFSRMKDAKEAVYEERNKCVALIAQLASGLGYPVYRAHTPIEGWDPEWCNCIFIELPTGQISWHYKDSERAMFAQYQMATGNPWDGHDTMEKYRRAAEFKAGPARLAAPLVENHDDQEEDIYDAVARLRTSREIAEKISLIAWLGYLPNEVPQPYDFRASNEWAGQLLDKLGYHNMVKVGGQVMIILGIGNKRYQTPYCDSWRGAVVEAALKEIEWATNGKD